MPICDTVLNQTGVSCCHPKIIAMSFVQEKGKSQETMQGPFFTPVQMTYIFHEQMLQRNSESHGNSQHWSPVAGVARGGSRGDSLPPAHRAGRAPFMRGDVVWVGQTPPRSLSITLGVFCAGHTQHSTSELVTSMWQEVTVLLPSACRFLLAHTAPLFGPRSS